MMHKALKGMMLTLVALVASQGVAAIPQPARIPASWELKFRYQDPQKVSVILPGHEKPVVYWYMLYTIENDTAREQEFYPEFELVTDTLQVVRSELKVSGAAFKAIRDRARDPLLIAPERIVGELQRGEDRARHGVAIFRDFEPQARNFTVYVAGLSGETQKLRNPAFDSDQPESETNKRYFVLRKTLAIPYRFPGTPELRPGIKPARVPGGQHWIMR